jgi:putative transposase
MAKGFVYLVAVMDWFGRRVLSWRLSITMEADFCVEALQEAITRHGQPDIFNTDQGVQFTSVGFLEELESRGIRISMDGKGRFLDNIFIERLWRSLKYEDVFIKAYGSLHKRAKALAAGCGSTTRSACTRHWATGRRVRCSMAKPACLWTTPPL